VSFLRVILKNYSIRQALRAEIEEDIGFLVRGLPGVLGFLIRYLAYKPFFKHIASIPYIYPGVRFVYMKNISLGRGVLINSYTYVYGKGGIEIGDKVLISPHCSLVAGNHNTSLDQPIIEQPSKFEKIVIGDNCWIGANAMILGGVTIGEGSIIGAGAIITVDIKPYSIVLGSRALRILDRREVGH
jgi:acetyltransferase-like isoleucine patch superfamily enzyme